jgi:hypothetical protein
VDGEKLGPGARVELVVGAELRFGREGAAWVVVDDAAPVAMAVAVEGGARVVSEGG